MGDFKKNSSRESKAEIKKCIMDLTCSNLKCLLDIFRDVIKTIHEVDLPPMHMEEVLKKVVRVFESLQKGILDTDEKWVYLKKFYREFNQEYQKLFFHFWSSNAITKTEEKIMRGKEDKIMLALNHAQEKILEAAKQKFVNDKSEDNKREDV